MDIVLVPGLWLDASSWQQVTPLLAAAGHRPHPLTLPGLESQDADRSSVSLADQVGAVVHAIDECDGPVAVVGHSLGSAIAWAATDVRPDRVSRVFLVGGFPAIDGKAPAGGFATDGADLPLPDLADFDETDLRDFDDEAKAEFVRRAIPSPASLTTDRFHLTDDRRYDVPVTAVCPEYTAAQLREWIDAGEGSVAEFTKLADVEYVDVPTGHWPQLTKPAELAAAITTALAPR